MDSIVIMKRMNCLCCFVQCWERCTAIGKPYCTAQARRGEDMEEDWGDEEESYRGIQTQVEK